MTKAIWATPPSSGSRERDTGQKDKAQWDSTGNISTILELAVPCKLDWKSPALAASLKTVTCCNSFCRLSFIMPVSSRSFVRIECTPLDVILWCKKSTSWYRSLKCTKWLCYFVSGSIETRCYLTILQVSDHNQYCNGLSWPMSIRSLKQRPRGFSRHLGLSFTSPIWLHCTTNKALSAP
jgi:hypothetical protein